MKLINLEYALQQIEIGEFEHRGVFASDSSHIKDFLNALPTVDAVPVDEIKFHHILIDKDGVPEVKLQFGERTLVLRRVDDPLDVVEVVHGQWVRKPIGKYTGVDEVCCSICGCFIGVVASDTAFREAILDMNYCYNCGAKMDGDKNDKL